MSLFVARQKMAGALVAVFLLVGSVPASAAEDASNEASQPEAHVYHGVHTRERPAALSPLYISFAAAQALDVHSTYRALEGGGREMNPVIARTIDSPAKFIALKAGVVVGTVAMTEAMWKRHPVLAVASMIGLNVAYSVIVARNYSIAR